MQTLLDSSDSRWCIRENWKIWETYFYVVVIVFVGESVFAVGISVLCNYIVSNSNKDNDNTKRYMQFE